MHDKRLFCGIGWRRAVNYLGGIALLTVSSTINAETTQQPAESTVEFQATPLSYVWIQDRHSGKSVLTTVREPDQSLWNAARIDDYEVSLKTDSAPAMGILTIKKLNIQVPIYNGTDEVTLDRGAGRIRGMARMDEAGNLGISGHRDGFFRGLKDIQVGDDILVQTTLGTNKYSVSSINIVPKEDASVLEPVDEKTLTLVTCYPFYFVGHAPERYIVTATPKPFTFEQAGQ